MRKVGCGSYFSKVKWELIGRSWLYTEKEKKWLICLESLVWINKNEHTPCLSFKKSSDAGWHLILQLPHPVAFFGLLSAKPATFEIWHMYIPFWIFFFHIYFDSVVFGNTTNHYLLWGHEAARSWGRALVSEWEDWSWTNSPCFSKHHL